MRRSPHRRRGGLRGVDYIESYCDAIQFFLNTFPKDEILSEAFRRVNKMKQNQNETEIDFANRLHNETLRRGNIFNEGHLTQMFIDGLNKEYSPPRSSCCQFIPNISFLRPKRV